MPGALRPGSLGGMRRCERDVDVTGAVGAVFVSKPPPHVLAELAVEAVPATLVLDDQGWVTGGDLGREPRAGLAQRGGQHARVGPVRHGQDPQEAPGRGLAARQDGVEDRRVRAARMRHVLRGPRDAATEHAGELAQEDGVPLREGLEALLGEPEEPRRRQRDDRG